MKHTLNSCESGIKARLYFAIGTIKTHIFVPMEWMDFDTYLRGKKIDEAAFKKEAPDQYQELKSVFDQVHPDSFTAQKLFLINPIRRKYQLKTEEMPKAVKPKAARPMIRPKPKTN